MNLFIKKIKKRTFQFYYCCLKTTIINQDPERIQFYYINFVGCICSGCEAFNIIKICILSFLQ